MEVSYLVGGIHGSNSSVAGARLSRAHSRAASGGSGASWDSVAISHSRNSSRAGGPDMQAAYTEASVSQMLNAGQDRYEGGLGSVR
jgi:hypothetical protein